MVLIVYVLEDYKNPACVSVLEQKFHPSLNCSAVTRLCRVTAEQFKRGWNFCSNTETHAGFFFLHSNSVRNFILYKSKLTQRSFLYKIRVELLLYSA